MLKKISKNLKCPYSAASDRAVSKLMRCRRMADTLSFPHAFNRNPKDFPLQFPYKFSILMPTTELLSLLIMPSAPRIND